MQINWKVRFRSKKFWVSIIALLAVLANQVAGVFDYDVTIISEQLTEIAGTVLLILSGIGIIVDPTTKGINDSERAMTYDKPKGDE